MPIRRGFLKLAGSAALGALLGAHPFRRGQAVPTAPAPTGSGVITLVLCGDVMTGRGIDQILPHPGSPRLCEEYMKSAMGYVELAEQVNGRISRPVTFEYIWGDALGVLRDVQPDVHIVNLETSVTTSDDCVPKGINYRMHPENIPCIAAAGIDCCTLANNHVLDWGDAGLVETLETLERSRVLFAGAGRDAHEASAPAVFDVPGKGRIVVYAYGLATSGIPIAWIARASSPGINLLPDLRDDTVRTVADRIEASKQPGDLTVVSIHWGPNWGYAIPAAQRQFARSLMEVAGVDVVHGHSSHHPKAIEIHRGKPILYGCGDFLTDYEGIAGHEEYRNDLVLMYVLDLRISDSRVEHVRMVPFRLRRFQLRRASARDVQWLWKTLDRECRVLGRRVEMAEDILRLVVH